MKDEDRENLARRWDEVNHELEELVDGKVQPGTVDMAARENALLVELDRIEYELGVDARERTHHERNAP